MLSAVVILTLTHRYNAVRGHRKGSNNSGAKDYLRRKINKKQRIIHTTTETNRTPQAKKKVISSRAYNTYQDTYECHMLSESQQNPKPSRQHSLVQTVVPARRQDDCCPELAGKSADFFSGYIMSERPDKL